MAGEKKPVYRVQMVQGKRSILHQLRDHKEKSQLPP